MAQKIIINYDAKRQEVVRKVPRKLFGIPLPAKRLRQPMSPRAWAAVVQAMTGQEIVDADSS